MRKHPLLITVAATALLAGAGVASAQRTEQPGASAPAQKSPDVAPAPKAPAAKPGTSGQSPAEPKAKDVQRPEAPKSGTSGQAPAEKTQPKAAQPDTKADTKSGAPTQKGAQPSVQTPTPSAQGTRTDAAATLTVEQRTRIRETVLKQSNVPRVSRVDFQINVGVTVPRTIRVVPLPGPVVEIYPAWREYHYFLVGDEIIVVEPGTMRIVAVLPA